MVFTIDHLAKLAVTPAELGIEAKKALVKLLEMLIAMNMLSSIVQFPVVLTAVEVESLRSEIAALEEREAHLKAQDGQLYLENLFVDDDTEVDDWLPRFLVLQGSCMFLYSSSIDLSPQDSTLLSDVVEVGAMPCLTRDNGDTRYCFFISTDVTVGYRVSALLSRIVSCHDFQVDSWLASLQNHCDLQSNCTAPDELTKT
ncbi:hypothetical protein HAX54_040940 [Datura stramonium]|uniref:PH domain-containing protein n=1 Tax=Datura stramonium TaxID=4076 RepID=A0ABS8SKX8_DATST|nr:hypothetical protein [Datura stramonium]